MMVKKIVSHLAPRHMDDFLAVALLKTKYPQAEIEYIHPQKVPSSYLKTSEVCLVDVGENFHPKLKNYDHHQDIKLPSSFILVLMSEFVKELLTDRTLVNSLMTEFFRDIVINEIMKGIVVSKFLKELPISSLFKSQVVRFIDLTDRYGFKKAAEIEKVSLNPEEDKMRKEILLVDLTKHGKEVGELVWETLVVNTYSEWIRTFYQKLDKKGLLDEPREVLEKENTLFKEKLAKAKILQNDGLKVLVSNETLAPNHFKVFSESGVDLIIERNSMNPKHTSIIKNTSSSKTKNIELAKVFALYPKVFLHQGGFIAVIDVPIEEVSVVKLLEVI